MRELPNKKRYLELITAFLSIPVLLTVVYLNLTNIQERKKEPEAKEAKNEKVTILPVQIKENGKQPAPKDDKECVAQVPRATLSYPREGETVADNPLHLNLSLEGDGYCSVVWSYRINGARWSDYDDRSIYLYNMDSGSKTLELRIKSIVSGEEKMIVRNFTYRNESTVPTPTSMPTAVPTAVSTQSAVLEQ